MKVRLRKMQSMGSLLLGLRFYGLAIVYSLMAFCPHLDVAVDFAVYSPASLFNGYPPAKDAYQRATTGYLQALVYHYRDLNLRLQHGIHACEDGHAQRYSKGWTLSRYCVTASYYVLLRQPQHGREEGHAEVDHEQA